MTGTSRCLEMRDGSPTPCPGRSRCLTSQVSMGPTTPVFSQTMNGVFFAANTTGYLASPAPLGHQAPEPPSAGTLPSGGGAHRGGVPAGQAHSSLLHWEKAWGSRSTQLKAPPSQSTCLPGPLAETSAHPPGQACGGQGPCRPVCCRVSRNPAGQWVREAGAARLSR